MAIAIQGCEVSDVEIGFPGIGFFIVAKPANAELQRGSFLDGATGDDPMIDNGVDDVFIVIFHGYLERGECLRVNIGRVRA